MLYYIFVYIDSGISLMMSRDPFQYSLMAQPAHARLFAIAAVLLCLWLAIAWAVSLP
jgi:hypothetical protein